MIKKISIRKFSSFKEAEEHEIEERIKMTPQERYDTFKAIRQLYITFNFQGHDPGFQRVHRFVKREQS